MGYWRRALLLHIIAAGLGTLWPGCMAQADDIEYSKIGWWQVSYREVGDLNGCNATTRFQDQTQIVMALIQQGNTKNWSVYISNPKWTWIGRNTQHTVFVAPLNPTKVWRDSWRVDDNNELYLPASIDFMNSLADAKALMIFDEDKRPLTSRPLNMKDTDAAIRTVVNCVRAHPPLPPSPKTQAPDEEAGSSSGTAFFVAPEILLTNDHVVKGCKSDIQVRYPDRKSYAATLLGLDETNDLAVLHTEMSNLSVAAFRSRARLGEQVATYGFPYTFVLSSSGNFTIGNITSLSGMRDDSRFLQISTPIQPGNSGGPLLDMSGSVVGVVQSQLNAMLMMQFVGSAPQNVNFAIQSPIVLNFLATKGITPKMDETDQHRNFSPSDLADLARKFTVQIYCEAAPPKTSERRPVPANPTTGTEQLARDFVLALQAKWSRPNAEALAGLGDMYQDEVVYFGKKVTRDQVIKDKVAFAQRFSERQYTPREPISIYCDAGTCTVHGLVEFRSVDPVAKVISEGVATFDYQLVISAGTLKIGAENGEVLRRNRTPLALISARPKETEETRVLVNCGSRCEAHAGTR